MISRGRRSGRGVALKEPDTVCVALEALGSVTLVSPLADLNLTQGSNIAVASRPLV